MTISIDQLTPEHQQVRVEAEARIRARITGQALERTVYLAPIVQKASHESDNAVERG